MPAAFPKLSNPIVQAPMAGGPSTPELAAAVANAGGLGFVAAGYRTADQLRDDIEAARELTDRPVGVNLFLVAESKADTDALTAYAGRIAAEAARYGAPLGAARFDDDALEVKLELVRALRVPIVSFTFGCPSPAVVRALQSDGIAVWVTVTEPDEGVLAAGVGADALVCQGIEAGGHRGTFEDIDGRGELGLLSLLRLTRGVSDLPLIASGGIADAAGVAAVLAAGAVAAQIGTALLLCPEAGTSAPHRGALTRPGTTALTRAFSGRRARGIVNDFMRAHEPHAPSAYPQVHHLTSPLRTAARAAGDPEAINLWAGQAFALAQERPAADLVRGWSAGI
ncbi:MAG TPA: nitronate monooxygenase [Solirubrobacteraceae bacterium]|jgi:nitronate monooxygenase|nr:nitronate monooxygenase [Solirubrobacteraceae bacterium]